jgi:hypothetical protein
MQRLVVISLAFVGASAAQAQADSPRQPTDPRLAAPTPQYRSAFADYQAYREPEVGNWRQANEEVKSAEGQGEHGAKAETEGKPPAKPAASGSETPSKPPAGGHAGHQ